MNTRLYRANFVGNLQETYFALDNEQAVAVAREIAARRRLTVEKVALVATRDEDLKQQVRGIIIHRQEAT